MGIGSLLATLPPLDVLGAADIESQARAVLRYVLHPAWGELVTENPLTCPNCDRPCASRRSPYCSESCREAAGFVRQLRAGMALGWILEPPKQVALGQVLWHMLGGGRPLRREIAPTKAREKAITRAGGLCEVCGTAATTVDHVGSGCNRPTNLRAVCEACCTDRAFGEKAILEGAAVLIEDLAARIASPTPLRCCDDADSWDWRSYLTKRSTTGSGNNQPS